MDFDVRVRRLIDRENTPVKAVCSVTFGHQYAVHGVKVVETKNGRFMTMPYETYTDAEDNAKRRDVFHPVTNEARQAMEEAVFAAYEEAKAAAKAAAVTTEAEKTEDETIEG